MALISLNAHLLSSTASSAAVGRGDSTASPVVHAWVLGSRGVSIWVVHAIQAPADFDRCCWQRTRCSRKFVRVLALFVYPAGREVDVHSPAALSGDTSRTNGRVGTSMFCHEMISTDDVPKLNRPYRTCRRRSKRQHRVPPHPEFSGICRPERQKDKVERQIAF